MKKIFKVTFVVLTLVGVLVCMSGCKLSKRNKKNNDGSTTYYKSFGSYAVESGWIESKSHSTSSKFFYVKDGDDDKKKPNNISINAGTNKYSKDDHESFKEAIYKQLIMQTSNSKGTTINGSGSTNEKGEIIYTFIMKSEDSVHKQYYIVGDYKYILIYETVWNLDDEDKVDSVAKMMIDSFEWKN